MSRASLHSARATHSLTPLAARDPRVRAGAVADAHRALGGDPRRALEQLDVGLVLPRDVRVFEKNDAPAAILEDFQRNFGVAAQRTGMEALHRWCVRRGNLLRKIVEHGAGRTGGDAPAEAVEECEAPPDELDQLALARIVRDQCDRLRREVEM